MLTLNEISFDLQDFFFGEVQEEAPAEPEMPFDLSDLLTMAVEEASPEPEMALDLADLLAVAADERAPAEVSEKAISRLRSRPGRNAVKRELVAIIETFDNPYVPGAPERYFVPTDGEATGEIIEFGKQCWGSQIFPENALRRNVEIYNDFMAFAKTQDTSDWRFWNVGLPNHKSSVKNLAIKLKRFKRVMNNELSELRKPGYIEILLIGVHLRYDDQTSMFDLHAHLICRVPKETHDLASSRLFRKFS